MGSGSRFRLLSVLKRTKSSVQPKARQQDWCSEEKEHKVQHLLGITETDLNTARNQSISSSVTTRLPTIAFSDATTELGSLYPPTDLSDQGSDLQLKASSVLLHEEFVLQADSTNSTQPPRLRTQGSASTLGSFYDAQKIPLAISQQTSESSRRDFALRKGAPVVVQPTNPDKDSLLQIKLFRLSRRGDSSATKKNMKLNSQDESTSRTTLAADNMKHPRSSHHTNTAGLLPPVQSSGARKDVHFDSDRLQKNKRSEDPEKDSAAPPKSPQSDLQVKVNIRRPRAGAKHWFDGLEGDSSGDESVHEFEFHSSFVAGMESAFGGGSIGTIAEERPESMDHSSNVSSQLASSKKSRSNHMLPASAIPPRASTLHAKSSTSTISIKESQRSAIKAKTASLASMDLNKTSVLDLSTSEDDEPPSHRRGPPNDVLPQLRDSIAVESLVESEIEIGTAKAIRTRQNSSLQATPSLKRVRGGHARPDRTSSNRPPVRQQPRPAEHNDASSRYLPDDDDLIPSFPTTPTMDHGPQRLPMKNRVQSDNSTVDSRRLISVTRQEESLLAAMRAKKAALHQVSGAAAQTDLRADAKLYRKTRRRHEQSPRSSAAIDFHLLPQTQMPERVQSPSSDSNFDQASCTTFQTGPTVDPSIRQSVTSFRTDPDIDRASSSASVPSALLEPPNATFNRMSRSTFFSTSSNSSRDNSRGRKESHYLSTLEKLQATPKRDEVSSQDFIDWPYRGWTKLATAY